MLELCNAAVKKLILRVCVYCKTGRLRLNNNALTGTVPQSLGDIVSLAELELQDNQLRGQVFPALGKLTALGKSLCAMSVTEPSLQ